MPADPSDAVLQQILATITALKDASAVTIKGKANGLMEEAAALDSSGLLRVTTLLETLGLPAAFRREWKQAVQEIRKNRQNQTNEVSGPPGTYQYLERGHCIFLLTTGNNGQVRELPIATFDGQIMAEITAENGSRTFLIEGHTAGGRPYAVKLSAEVLYQDARLCAAIVQAAGASAIVYANCGRHIAPAIQSLTGKQPRQVRTFNRTGWSGSAFLIDGLVSEDVLLELPEKLPFQVDKHADLQKGLQALEALVHAQKAQLLVGLTLAFQAPLAKLADWQSERYGVMFIGQTGTYKTSIAMLIMTLYGRRFQQESNLIRVGPGSTANAIITYATYAHDLPILIDNFKPNTMGERGLVNLIQAIMEGGDRDRLGSAFELQATRSISAWSLLTGEDSPAHDPASIARLLIVLFEPQGIADNPALSEAQRLADHLPAVGRAWLAWLTAPESQAVIKKIGERFTELRQEWLLILKKAAQQSVNASRIATNLATNEMTWMILEQHPALGPFAARYRDQHRAALLAVANTMAGLTSNALEASVYLETLAELVASGRAKFLPAFHMPETRETTGFIGWRGDDGSYYLLPQLARQAVEDVMRTGGGMNHMSSHALYMQLDALGLIQSRDSGGTLHTKTIRNGQNRPQKVLHLAARALEVRG